MLAIIFRYVFIICSTFFTFFKILKITPKMRSVLTILIFSFGISTFFTLSTDSHSLLRRITIFFTCFLFISFYSKIKFSVSFSAFLLALILSYISLAVTAFLFSTLLVFSDWNTFFITGTPFIVLYGSLQMLLLFLLFKIKRLKNGMPFLYKINTFWPNTIMLSLIGIYVVIITFSDPSNFPLNLISMAALFFLSFVLLHWWKKMITQSYLEKLRLVELEDLYRDLSDKDKQIEQLKNSNRTLDRIIHKDNKLIPAMEMAICNYLQNASTMNPDNAMQYGNDLLKQLQNIYKERKDILTNYQKQTSLISQTRIPTIDAVLLYMEKRALENNIRYEVISDGDVKDSIFDHVEESDALHLLSDMIENAIAAVSHERKGQIKIHIGFFNNHLFLDIYDNGVPFTIQSYQNFGNFRYTTHPFDGGSGIGLTDIWEIKQKYRASLQIYEYPPYEKIYTKRIRLFFDKKNHFLIQTYRSEELTKKIIRNDIHIFSHNEYPLQEFYSSLKTI